MKKIFLIPVMALFIFSSCKKNLPTVGGTATQSLANEWWVTFTVNGVDVYGLGHKKIVTYNTAANTNEIWVDDYQNLWQFKVKAQANLDSLTFHATAAPNEYYNITVNLTNGKVFPGLGHSRTGNVTDSIYMQAEFSDDPGTIYTISGHARTRFAEDDY
jgi:hypothetical protein